MPFYEYQCSACGSHHEELQKITARPLRKCPACGRSTLRRLISAPVFRLKGGGWYETDFKGDKEPAAEKPKEEKPEAKVADAKPADSKVAAETTAQPAAADKKPKPAAVKPVAKAARNRRRPARR